MTERESAPSVNVLVADAISEKGIDVLRNAPGVEVTVRTGMSPTELAEAIADADGLVVRSATKVTPEVLEHAGRLKVIGRAGPGVDNIDHPAATRAGVVVMNTPGGNSVAAAEHTISLLTALARNVAQANADLRQGRWERKKYMGVEIAGKTIGIVGLGRIGREVARRAAGLRMQLLGHDPFVNEESVKGLGVAVCPLDELLARADFVTLHLPLSDNTRNTIDAAALARMKPGARLINCARGGLVDEAALLEALQSGRLAGAGLDVFATEPPSDRALVEHPAVVATPHLGASTIEAQQRVGTEIAEKIVEFFRSGVMLDAVNFPALGREEYGALQPLMNLAERLGSFLAQVSGTGMSRLDVQTFGEFGEHSIRPLAMAAAKGILSHVVEGAVSYVNALDLAQSRGLTVSEGRSSETTPYSGLLRLGLTTADGKSTVAGTLFSERHPRLVEVDGVPIESFLEGRMLFARNRDVPGVYGRIGTILGEAGVNIAGLQLGRISRSETAVSVISIDDPVPQDALKRILEIPEILTAKTVRI